ncbi:MAG: PTS sugar transporter subunit IIC [Clostridium chrysemydis]|uniref:PTS sugar transporter subunit IIC n=1 Tax=Clostridium TaxID=1485 RepID=UPI0021523FD4|nr:PTS sugar transporter subunit IIC [Clostridium sp. LY3-2]MCR6514030.1 PTS sugar transporter subunit IIC [Clostridium sp. LY3-2]
MSSKIDKFVDKIMPVVGKIAGQRHLCAIRDGFIVLMPLIIGASIFVLLNNVVLDSNNGILKSFVNLDKYKEIGVIANNATLGILAILFAFTLSYNLAKSYDEDGVNAGVIGVSVMATMIPQAITIVPEGLKDSITVSGVISSVNISSSGLFLAIIAGLLGTELFIKLSRNEKLKIKLPDAVPYGVSKSFNVMIPSIITLTVFSVLVFFINQISSVSIPELISKLIQAPLQSLVQNPGGMIFITFISNLLWAFGIHGSSILSPITSPTLLAAIQENMNAFNAGLAVPNIVTEPFINSYSLIGGGGCMLSLVIAIFIASKRSDHREIGKLAALPSVFNISEPIMFGLPVVLNPIFILPVVLVPALNLIIAYYVTALGFVSKTVALVPWTTPPVISAFLATGGDYRAAILSTILLVLSVIIYIPFVLMANREQELENKK